MATETEPRTEALPGYRLIEMIGRGGFGEVWKVEAPGGLMKACKFIHGRIVAGDDTSGAKVHRELKGLERLKSVRHPFILSLERIDIVDGQLVVIMELADRDLEHRLREVKEAGMPGIPRGELLKYMVETAEALDVMNVEYDIQHLDIKPSNIFLVRGHVKVADFGLSKGFEGRIGRMSGGITPIYAAPETFDGWVSRHTDQYSLAILYQEMLTGMRPFPGPSPRQLMVQHMTGEPDLSSLPESDRAVVRKALSKKPDDRYPNCSQFAEQLLAAEAGGIENLLQAARMSVSMASMNQPQILEPQANKETVEGFSTSISTVSIPKPFAPTRTKTPSITRALPPPMSAKTAAFNRISVTKALPKLPELRRTARKSDARPTLVVGLGGQGGRVVESLRKQIAQRLESTPADSFRWLWLDCGGTAASPNASGIHRASDLADGLIRCAIPPHLRTPDAAASPTTARSTAGTGEGTGGRRRLGRAGLNANQIAVRQRLRTELATLEKAKATSPGVVPAVPRVVLVAAMGGGAGGGMLIDTAYWIRQLAKAQSIEPLDIECVLLAGVASDDQLAERRKINHVAVVGDLSRFMDAKARHRIETDSGQMEIAGPAFQVVYLIDANAAVYAHDKRQSATQNVAEFIVETSAAALGRLVRQAEGDRKWPAYRSFGLGGLIDPELKTARNVAARLCENVFAGWMGEIGESEIAAVVRSVGERWHTAKVGGTQVNVELKQAADERFGRTVENAVSQMAHLVESNLGRDGDIDLKSWTLNSVQRLRGLLDSEAEAEKATSWIGALEAIRPRITESLRKRLEEIASHAAAEQPARLSALDVAQTQIRRVVEQFVAETEARRQAARTRLDAAVEVLQYAMMRSASVADRNPGKTLFNALKSSRTGKQLSPAVAEFAREFLLKLREHAAAFVEEHLERAVLACYEDVSKKWKELTQKSRPRQAQLELISATLGSSAADQTVPAVYAFTSRQSGGIEAAANKVYENMLTLGPSPFERTIDVAIESAGGLAALLDRFDKEGPDCLRGVLDAGERFVLQRLNAGEPATRFLEQWTADPTIGNVALKQLFEAAKPTLAGPATGGIDEAFLATSSEQTAPKLAAAIGQVTGKTPAPISGGTEIQLLRIVAAETPAALLPDWIRDTQAAFEAACAEADSPNLFGNA